MKNPFDVLVYNKSLKRVGFLNDYESLSVTKKHNAAGMASLTLATTNDRLGMLNVPGTRLVIRFRSPWDADQSTKEHLMSGYLAPGPSGEGPTKTGKVTINLEDDLSIFDRWVGYPAPAADINSQGTGKDTRTGTAETVAKAFLTANAHNYPDPILVAPDLGRGSVITAAMRMDLLGEVLFPLVGKANIGLSAQQVNNQADDQGLGILVDAYTPRVYPHTLSEDAGTINNYTYSRTDGVTRVIVAGPFTDTSREFKLIIDPREAQYGYSRTLRVDASSAEASPGITQAQAILKAGTDALAENGPKTGFTVELAENKTFHYGGNGVHVGDRVTLDINGVTYTDVLKEVNLTYDFENGLIITPTIGEHSDDPDVILSNAISSLSGTVAKLLMSRG